MKILSPKHISTTDKKVVQLTAFDQTVHPILDSYIRKALAPFDKVSGNPISSSALIMLAEIQPLKEIDISKKSVLEKINLLFKIRAIAGMVKETTLESARLVYLMSKPSYQEEQLAESRRFYEHLIKLNELFCSDRPNDNLDTLEPADNAQKLLANDKPSNNRRSNWQQRRVWFLFVNLFARSI